MKKQPLTQDQVFESTHVLQGVLSPDVRTAVYELSETIRGKDPGEDRQCVSLWQVSTTGGRARRLTSRGVDATSPQFTADGKAVFFLSARDASSKVQQVHRLPLDGGEAQQVTELEQGVTMFALSPDGRSFAFAAMEELPQPLGPDQHVRIDRLNYRFDPVPGYIQDVSQAVYVARVSAGGRLVGKPKALTEHDGIVSALAWSPDGEEIAFVRNVKKASSVFGMLGDLCVVDRAGKTDTLVSEGLVQMPFWTRDGKMLGYCAPPNNDLSRQGQLWLTPRKVGKKGASDPESRSADLGVPVPGFFQMNSPSARSAGSVKLSDDGSRAYVMAGAGGEGRIVEIALSGTERCDAVVSGQRICRVLDRVGQQLLFNAQDCLTPSELFLLDLETGEEKALTSHNETWQSKVSWPKVERVSVPTPGGAEIEGWVLVPTGKRRPHKTILYIHGGPHAAFGCSFNEDMHELAGAGYAVVFANPRGSVGYGDDFASAILGCWGKPEQEDFDALLDELVERKLVHPRKIGVTGVSGGGHLSAWLIGQTDRFAAAVPEQGVYNMFSMYGVSDAGPALISLEMGGAPHECPETYWELSPVAHAHKCTTPTLLIQGEQDIRCPMEQAEQLFAVLKLNGCEVEFLRLQNCNHGLELMGPPPLRRYRMDAMKEWFARYV